MSSMNRLAVVSALEQIAHEPHDVPPWHTKDIAENALAWFRLDAAEVEALRNAVFEEWGHDWKTQPACRRILGAAVYDALQERTNSGR